MWSLFYVPLSPFPSSKGTTYLTFKYSYIRLNYLSPINIIIIIIIIKKIIK